MALLPPLISYSVAGGPFTPLASGAQGLCTAGQTLAVQLQSTVGVSFANWSISAVGTPLQGTIPPTWYAGPLFPGFTITMPASPIAMVLTTSVSDGNNTTSVSNSFISQSSSAGGRVANFVALSATPGAPLTALTDIVEVNAATGNVILQVASPSARAAVQDCGPLVVVAVNGATFNVQIAPNGSETFNGLPSWTLSSNWGTAQLWTTGSAWLVV